MPKRTYACLSCKKERQLYVSDPSLRQVCDCGGDMTVQPPRILGMDVTEMVDSNKNIRWKQDQQEMIEERRLDYFYEHEVPRLINEYSLQVCLEEGWLYYDDKGQLQARKKPPQRD